MSKKSIKNLYGVEDKSDREEERSLSSYPNPGLWFTVRGATGLSKSNHDRRSMASGRRTTWNTRRPSLVSSVGSGVGATTTD